MTVSSPSSVSSSTASLRKTRCSSSCRKTPEDTSFNYDRRSATLFEKRFNSDYRFMKVEHMGEETFYTIEWKDVALLLENAVVNKLVIK